MKQFFLFIVCLVVVIPLSRPMSVRGQGTEQQGGTPAAQAPPPASQSPSAKQVTFGVFGAVNINQHLADFPQLPGVPTATGRAAAVRFGNALGFGFTVGGLADIPFSDQLGLSLRLSYATHSATLQAFESEYTSLLNTDGTGVMFYDSRFRRDLATNLGTIGLEPLLRWSPLSSVPDLHIFAGLRVGYLIQNSFNQSENLLEPGDTALVWNTGGRVRNLQGGDIPDVQRIHLAATGGIGYDIKVGNIVLSPEAFYSYSFTPVIGGFGWNINTIRGGFSVRYVPDLPPAVPNDTIAEPPIAQNPPEKTDTAKKTSDVDQTDENQKSTLNASISAFMVDSSGAEHPLVRLRVEQFFAWQMYPLMNYIFFEQNAPGVPPRYRMLKTKEETANFSEQDFHNVNMLRVYYDVLNIIGKRMQQIKTAKIQLVGCNNNIGLESGNIPLSYRRADEIRRYMIDIWGIDSSRVTLQARNLPEKPTMSRDSLGVEENRRVEIYSDVWDILKPVLVNDTINIPEPPTIRFRMNIKASDGVAKSALTVTQGQRGLKLFTIQGKPDSTLDWSPIIDWNTIADQGSAPSTPDNLKFGLEVTDKKGKQVNPYGEIPVELITVKKKREANGVDKQLAIYRLILFDFNSPAVGKNNARIINSFILDNLRDGSKMDITGFTDKLGNPDTNMRLSSGRAKSVADFIKWRDAQFRGVGGTRPQYTNETPEGRIYNRSVEVRVETPIIIE
jgi:outer membrane protein OmpA-like peptidoglycan-associated protein